MLLLFGLLFVGSETSGSPVDEFQQPEFKVEVRILELKSIKGITKQATDSQNHLRIKPGLVVATKDVVTAKKRFLRGPTIGNKKTGFKHYPRLVVDLQLTNEAKQRLKAAVQQARPSSTTNTPIVAIVVNGKHDGAWSKYWLEDSTTSSNLWSNFTVRISCSTNEKKADQLIKQFKSVRPEK